MSRSQLSGRRDSVSAFIALGGNIGDPESAMCAALDVFAAAPDISVIGVSGLYRTPAWGPVRQPDYLNAVAELLTRLSPRALLEFGLEVERGLNRVRRERWGPRLIDVDILVYDALTIDEPGLEIPHPRMLERPFVMVPLAEIAAGLSIGGATAAEHAARLDRTGIARIKTADEWWRRRGE
jgi:2-amino-4-hydroxy-6-hydroxymethyldihydropteridine diphosphokinase